MRARVNQRVMDDHVAALRQRREDGDVGGIAAAEKQCAFGLEESGGFSFQRFMFRMITAKKTRPAGTDGDTALKRGCYSGFEARRFSEPQIVVRREIDAALLRKCPASSFLLELT